MGRKKQKKIIRRIKGRAQQCPLLTNKMQIVEGNITIAYDPSLSISIGKALGGSDNDLQFVSSIGKVQPIYSGINPDKIIGYSANTSKSTYLYKDLEEGGGFPLEGLYQMSNIKGFLDTQSSDYQKAKLLEKSVQLEKMHADATFDCGCITDEYDFRKRNEKLYSEIEKEIIDGGKTPDISNINTLISEKIAEAEKIIGDKIREVQEKRKSLDTIVSEYNILKEEKSKIQDQIKELNNKHKKELEGITDKENRKSIKDKHEAESKEIKERDSVILKKLEESQLKLIDESNKFDNFKKEIESAIKPSIAIISKYKPLLKDQNAFTEFLKFEKSGESRNVSEEWKNPETKYKLVTSPAIGIEKIAYNEYAPNNRQYRWVPKEWIEKSIPVCVAESDETIIKECSTTSKYKWYTESEWENKKNEKLRLLGKVDFNKYIRKDKEEKFACIPLTNSSNITSTTLGSKISKTLNDPIVPFISLNQVVFYPKSAVNYGGDGKPTLDFLEENGFKTINWKDIIEIVRKDKGKIVERKYIPYLDKTKKIEDVILKGYELGKNGDEIRKNIQTVGDLPDQENVEIVCSMKKEVPSLWNAKIGEKEYKIGEKVPFNEIKNIILTPEFLKFKFFGFVDPSDILPNPKKMGHQCEGRWYSNPKLDQAAEMLQALREKEKILKTQEKRATFANIEFIPKDNNDILYNSYVSSSLMDDVEKEPVVAQIKAVLPKIQSELKLIKEDFFTLLIDLKEKQEAQKIERERERKEERASEKEKLEKEKKKIETKAKIEAKATITAKNAQIDRCLMEKGVWSIKTNTCIF